jgi:phosphoribosylformylglycinamidine synthase
VENALHSLGFDGVSSVHVGRHVVIGTESETAEGAAALVTAMCERLLANPVTEDFEIESATAA